MNVFDLAGKLTLDKSEYDKNLSGASKEAKSFSSGFSKVGSGIATAMKVGAGAIGVVAGATTALGVGFSKAVRSTSKYGDTVDKASQKIGLSAESYQKWDYIMQRAGSSVSALKVGMKTLATQANNNSDAFKELGISQNDLSKYSQEELLETTIKKLAGMEKGTKRTALASQLLGRSSIELGPLLNGGTKAIEEQMKIAEDYGMVMSDKAVKASATFEDSITTMSMTFTGLKNRMMGEFLPAVTKVTDGLALLFTGDTKGLDDINKGLSSIVDRVSKMMPKILKVAGSMIEAIAGSLIKNAPKLFNAVIGIINSMATFVIDNMPKFIKIAMNVLFMLVDTILKKTPDLITMLSSVITQIITSISEQLPTLLTKLVEALPVIIETLLTEGGKLLQAGLKLIQELANGIIIALPKLIEKLPKIISSIVKFFQENAPKILKASVKLLMAIVNALPKIIDALADALPKIIDAIISLFTNEKTMSQMISAYIKLFGALVKASPKIIASLVKAIVKIIKSLVTSFESNFPKILSVGVKMFKQIAKGLKNGLKDLPAIGKDIVKGIWSGIADLIPWLTEKIKGFGSGITKSLKKVLKIKSPSRVTMEMGVNLDKGLALGLDKNNDAITFARKKGLEVSQALEKVMTTPDLTVAGDGNIDVSSVAKGKIEDNTIYNSILNLLNMYLPYLQQTEKDIVLDSGVLVGQLAPTIDTELGKIYRRRR